MKNKIGRFVALCWTCIKDFTAGMFFAFILMFCAIGVALWTGACWIKARLFVRVGEGSMVPRGYGVTYIEPHIRETVCSPILLNVIFGLIRRVWIDGIRFPRWLIGWPMKDCSKCYEAGFRAGVQRGRILSREEMPGQLMKLFKAEIAANKPEPWPKRIWRFRRPFCVTK
jgi:hypothetical protein